MKKGGDFIFLSLLDIPKNLVLQQASEEILKTNEKTLKYQLVLTKQEAMDLVENRNEVLKSSERIELGGGVVNQIIECFCSSPFISQYNYVETINELVETFYYYKNETLEEISDEDLIQLMKELFDGVCKGSMELLQGRELIRIAHNIRYGVWEESIATEMEEEIDE